MLVVQHTIKKCQSEHAKNVSKSTCQQRLLPSQNAKHVYELYISRGFAIQRDKEYVASLNHKIVLEVNMTRST